jgi:hypothetical protein
MQVLVTMCGCERMSMDAPNRPGGSLSLSFNLKKRKCQNCEPSGRVYFFKKLFGVYVVKTTNTKKNHA